MNMTTSNPPTHNGTQRRLPAGAPCELFGILRELAQERHPELRVPDPIHAEPRPGDVRHSQADIGKARRLLGYAPTHDARAGLRETLAWYDARTDSGRTYATTDPFQSE